MSLAKVTVCGLKQTGANDYEILLEDLEFAFPKHQLADLCNDWNAGADIELLAKRYKRDIDEIFLALFHLARKKKIKRPIAKLLKN